jgi:hypothetical protein
LAFLQQLKIFRKIFLSKATMDEGKGRKKAAAAANRKIKLKFVVSSGCHVQTLGLDMCFMCIFTHFLLAL